MEKRKALEVQKQIFEYIKKHEGISISRLERAIGTNPASLREHLNQLSYLGLINQTVSDRQRNFRLK